MSEATKPDKRVVNLYQQTTKEIKELEGQVADFKKKVETINGYFASMEEASPGALRPGSIRPRITALQTDRDELLRIAKPLEAELVSKRRLLEELDICPVCEGYGYDNSPRPVSEGPDPHIPPCHKCGGSGTKTGIKKEEERVASIPKCDFSDFCSNHDEGTLI